MRIAKNATTVSTKNPSHRNASTMTCGMARNHLTIQSQRLRGSSSFARMSTGYVDAPASATAAVIAQGSPTSSATGAATSLLERVPNTSRPAEAPAMRTPAASRPMPIHNRTFRRTPTLTSAVTPRAASVRMTTTDQRPLRGFHCSVWVPAPLDDATQMRADPGGGGVRAAGHAVVAGAESAVMITDVLHLVVGDAPEIRLHIGLGRDTDEQRRVAGRVDADARGRVEGVDRQVRGAARVAEIDALAGQRVGARREARGGGGVEAVAVALRQVRGEKRGTPDDQRGGQEREQAARDERDHASRTRGRAPQRG